MDFTGKVAVRGRPPGCVLPENTALELLAMDANLAKSGKGFPVSIVQPLAAPARPSATIPPRNPGKRKRVEVSGGTVRFADKTDVILIPPRETAKGTATTDPKRRSPDKDDPQKDEDQNALAWIAAGLLAFAGLFYYGKKP